MEFQPSKFFASIIHNICSSQTDGGHDWLASFFLAYLSCRSGVTPSSGFYGDLPTIQIVLKYEILLDIVSEAGYFSYLEYISLLVLAAFE